MKLRDKIFTKKVQFEEKEVDFDGDKIILRQPDLKVRSDIYKQAAKTDAKKGNMEVDITKLQVYTVIYCAFDPETDKRIFNKGDYKKLSESALGTYVINKLADEAMQLMEAELDPKKQEKS